MTEQWNDITIEDLGAGPCRSYRPGHKTHWIMANLYRSAPSQPARILAIQRTKIFLQIGEVVITWLHHDPDRLATVVRQCSQGVRVIEECTAIVVDRGSTTLWFYCASRSMDDCIFQ